MEPYNVIFFGNVDLAQISSMHFGIFCRLSYIFAKREYERRVSLRE